MKLKEKQHSKEDYTNYRVARSEQRNDTEVWESFRKGDQSAAVFLYNKYFDTLYQFAFQFSQDQDFIKDCIQDLFVELIKKPQKSKVTSVKSYLMVSLKRKILYYQKRLQKFIYRNDLLEGYDFQLSFSHETKIIGQQFEVEKKEKLNRIINTVLTLRQREAIFYLYYEQLTIDEMAEVMQLSRRAAQNLLYKSIKILKQNLLFLLNLILQSFIGVQIF